MKSITITIPIRANDKFVSVAVLTDEGAINKPSPASDIRRYAFKRDHTGDFKLERVTQ